MNTEQALREQNECLAGELAAIKRLLMGVVISQPAMEMVVYHGDMDFISPTARLLVKDDPKNRRVVLEVLP